MSEQNEIILDKRLEELRDWLTTEAKLGLFSLEPASADASFRRYFRAVTHDERTYIVMDAPPEKENCAQFVNTALILQTQGVHVPQIHAKNLERGFILLEDLGATDYLSELKASKLNNSDRSERLYGDALQALRQIQSTDSSPLPNYSDAKLREEMSLFTDWFLDRHFSHQLTPKQEIIWRGTQDQLVTMCLTQPQVAVHRDFHSRNLMVTEHDNPGVIDFQDMVAGPIAYDLASIFKDCYIEWPRQQQLAWLSAYYEMLEEPPFSEKDLAIWYDLTGLQRHLKVLGIFCRLNYRDGKAHYLNDLPLVAKYCLEVMGLYPQLSEFNEEFAPLISAAL